MKLGNIFVEPKVTFHNYTHTSNDSGNNYRLVTVDGLICESICENRVIAALSSMPNIEKVYHKPGSDSFIIDINDETLDNKLIESHILSKVIMIKIRKLLSWTRKKFQTPYH